MEGGTEQRETHLRYLEVSFNSGGVKCAATIYRSPSNAGLVGCVVMGNGITLTRKHGIPDYAQRFANAGLVVLAFDCRHWGDSDGDPRRWVSLRRQLEDWRAAVGYARELEGVDPERIAVWGMSLGGGLTLMTAAADPRIARPSRLSRWRTDSPPCSSRRRRTSRCD